jgi:hypothetical protein
MIVAASETLRGSGWAASPTASRPPEASRRGQATDSGRHRVITTARRRPRHRERTGGAVSNPLTDWVDHRSRPCEGQWSDTRGRHRTPPKSPVTAFSTANFIQQVAYQSSGNGIKGQPDPLSLAALGTGAFRDGERGIKTFRSSGSSVAISGNRLNSGRIGGILKVDPPPNSGFPNHAPDAPITSVSQARSRGHCFGQGLPVWRAAPSWFAASTSVRIPR